MSGAIDNLVADEGMCSTVAQKLRSHAALCQSLGDEAFEITARFTPAAARLMARRLDGGGIESVEVRRAKNAELDILAERVRREAAALRLSQGRREQSDIGLAYGVWKALAIASAVFLVLAASGVLS